MFLKEDMLRWARRIMICMLVLLLMMQVSLAEAPVTVQNGPSATAADAVAEEGTQLHTGPVLMVTDYTVVEGDKVPGSSFVLEMNIANLSETASAHNVLATLKIENVSVSIQEGVTNQLYFHEIAPGDSVTAQFPLEVYSYCSEENMILSMTMTCYDDAAVHYDFQTMMTPDIDVVRTVYVGSLTVPRFVHRNSSMIISATLTNLEPVSLNNVRMHVVTQYGEKVTDVGRMLNGESKTVDCMYRFPEQQTENVQIYFTYESLSGHEFATEVRSFEVVVYDPEKHDAAAGDKLSFRDILDRLVQNIEIPGMDAEVPVPVAALIFVGCAGFAVVMYFALRRKRK